MKHLFRAIQSGHPATLFAAFIYFDVSFMIWVLIGALGIYISIDLQLSPGQKGLIVSIPLLGGAAFRVLVGFLVDRIGPKKVGIATLSLTLIPLMWGWFAASSFYELIALGFLLGISGASFAVALPLASRCYPEEHQGIALGIAGAGNSGTMIAVLLAPFLAESFGWHAVFGFAIIPVIVVLWVFCRFAKEYGEPPQPIPFSKIAALVRSSDLWRFNLYYGVTFGGFVGMASFMGIFLHDEYHVRPVLAGGLTALSVFGGSFVRPIGGYLADRVGGMKLLIGLYAAVALCFLVVASLPPLWPVVVVIFLGMLALGMGNGAIFREVPLRFPENVGFVSGIIGAAGGLGGFFLPTLLGAMKAGTESFSGGFLLFSGIAFCCGMATLLKVREMPVEAVFVEGDYADGRVRMEVVFGG